ncbi:metal ABC transporter solute-binding protein, Zn/Mn family [Tumebacillus algifaecis]|nr:zinc ABC transporter substrate-binding protein [Tumebacillus algifaecis]
MKRMVQKMMAIGLGLSLVLAVGCSESDGPKVGKTVKEGEKVVVYSTLQAQASFAKEIGGDKVDVQTYMPPGQNFWQWAPTLKEMRDLEQAHVMILNGNGVEDRWWDQMYATVKIKNDDLLVIDASQGLDKLNLLRYYNPDASEDDKVKKRFDPWHYLDPQNAKVEVDTIATALSKKAPAYAEEFQKNAEEFKHKLDQLDQEYADTLSKVKRKEIVSPYPAFQYLTKRYGLNYYVPTSIAINEFPQDKFDEMDAVKVDFAKHDAANIFFEGEAAPRVQEFLGQMGYQAKTLNTYEGKMEPDKLKGYLQVMEENLAVLKEALNQ